MQLSPSTRLAAVCVLFGCTEAGTDSVGGTASTGGGSDATGAASPNGGAGGEATTTTSTTSTSTGCVPDAGGEICDGVDNDCDGSIDAADDSMATSCEGAEACGGTISCEDGVATCICTGAVWTRSFGAQDQIVVGVAVAAGKTAAVVAGAFTGTIDFGVTTLTAPPTGDILILKVDYDGQPEWALGAGNSNYQDTRDVEVDAQDNIVVVGGIQGPLTIGGVTMTTVGGYDVQVTKLDPSGDVLWAHAFPSSGDAIATSVAIAPTGEVVFAGFYAGSQSFEGTTLPTSASQDGFVTKLDADGSLLWSRSASGVGNEAILEVAVDSEGNTLAVGYFTDPIQVAGVALNAGGSTPLFLVKLDPNGEVVWAHAYAQYSGDGIWTHVGVDSDDNVVFYGSYRGGPVDLGGGPLPLVGTNTNMFVSKFNPSGAHLWSESFGGADGMSPEDMAIDAAGNLLFTGYLVGTADFGGGPLTADADPDILLVKLAPDGTHLWSKIVGSAGYQVGNGVAADEFGYVTVTGYFHNAIDFGAGPLTALGEDLFVTRFMP